MTCEAGKKEPQSRPVVRPEVYLSANETGTSQLAETFLGGRYELPPVRQVRRLEDWEVLTGV